MSVEQCKIVDLPQFADGRGGLGVIEAGAQVPFEIKRIYYLYGVPDGSVRGEHGHRELEQLIVAMTGHFRVILDDGYRRRSFDLDTLDKGLYVAPMMWRTIERFSDNAVCMVVASAPYNEDDYFRSYAQFCEAARKP